MLTLQPNTDTTRDGREPLLDQRRMNSEQRKLRMNYLFMKESVESSPVVPIQKHWLDSMLSFVPQSLQKGKDSEALVADLLEEVSQDFEKSMKRHLVSLGISLSFSLSWYLPVSLSRYFSMASNRTSRLPPADRLSVHLPPLTLPTTSLSTTGKKLMRHKRSREQQTTLNGIIMKEALKAYEETVTEQKRRIPSPPEPQLPSTMNSEQRKLRMNYLFMKESVESSPVVPIQKHWLDSMLSFVPQSLQKGKDSEALVADLLEEVSQDFEKSMKRHLVIID
ncbi:dynein axonemal heavy chain 12-like [Phyllobates terribilis]|uniref:dynein axonemal heavy chain 12-like n=1 Tax=Phyllobates terribilis TaxID=111132 RepID=UPI003CCAEF34